VPVAVHAVAAPGDAAVEAWNAEGQPVVFQFRRSGLAWKLTGIDLPED